MKFKLRQKVRFIGDKPADRYFPGLVGATGVIETIETDIIHYPYQVKWDIPLEKYKKLQYFIYANETELEGL